MSTSRIFDRLALAASLALALFVAASVRARSPSRRRRSATFTLTFSRSRQRRRSDRDLGSEDLPGQLAQALAGRITRGGAPLTVRIDYLTLGPPTGEMLHASATLDNILGVAVINGDETPIRATTSFYINPIAQTMIEELNCGRVAQLSQAYVCQATRQAAARWAS